MEKSKLEDYSIMKVIGILLVVLGHATRMYTVDGIITPLVGSKVLNYLTLYIYSFHMPLFIFVSGAIYFYVKQEKGKYTEFKSFAINKAKRVLVPYIIFGVLYVTPVMLLLNLTKENTIKFILKNIILSLNPRHLWYVLVLFIIFIIFFIAEKYIKKVPTTINILILFCVYILSGKLPAILQISATAHYLIFFYLGYIFQENKNKVENLNRPFLLFIVAFIFNLILLVSSVYINNSDSHVISAIGNVVYWGASIFGISYIYLLSLIVSKTNVVKSKVYKWLDKDGFGIYLFHPMIIYTIFYLLKGNKINPFLLAFSAFIIALIISDLATKLIRKINLGFIIGEKYTRKSISTGKSEKVEG